MAQCLCTPLLLLAALALTLAQVVSSQRNSRVGAPWDADVNDEDVQKALTFALSEYNKASNDENHSRVLRVEGARKQVVAGMNYFLNVEIGRTKCTKSEPNLESCPFYEQPDLLRKKLCFFQIHTIPWVQEKSVVKSHCHDA
ncbi:cystatin-C-like [Suricata suricatta]|uniref:Cystatin domain-containing protein n=1 Tax=Suricata suricatta TaxID=37032 RepID=A0A673THJ6_SURSU|nr:cystatin-C-like [Suricata suricatta]